MRTSQIHIICGIVVALIVLISISGAWVFFRPQTTEKQSKVFFEDDDKTLPSWLVSEVKAHGPKLEVNYDLVNPLPDTQCVIFKGGECGCSGVFVEGRELGQSDELSLEPTSRRRIVMTTRLSPVPSVNSYGAWFQIKSNNVDSAPFAIHHRLKVFPDIEVNPGVLAYTFRANSPHSVETTIRIRRFTRGVAPGPTSSAPKFISLPSFLEHTKTEELGSPGERIEASTLWRRSWQATLLINCDPSLPSSATPERFQVVFDDDATTVINVPVLIRRAIGISYAKFVYLGVVSPGQKSVKRARLRASDDCEFKILSLVTSSAFFSGSCATGLDADQHWLDIEFSSEKADTHKAQLIVNTSHPDCPQLSIELCAAVLAEKSHVHRLNVNDTPK